MKRFGLRAANQQFARLIRAVRAGEEVVLLDRGEPLAVITPLRKTDGVLERLAAQGLMVRARRPGLLPPFRPVRVAANLSNAVLEERNDRG